jgi:hypothetical protein
MKILRAKKYIAEIVIPLQLFKVKDIRIIPSTDWIINRSNQFGYKDSFDNKGMIYPIVVSDEKEDWVQKRILPKNPHHRDENGQLIKGLYVHVGNKRVLYAQQNNYDMIEGYFVKEQKDKTYIQRLQHISHTKIPK